MSCWATILYDRPLVGKSPNAGALRGNLNTASHLTHYKHPEKCSEPAVSIIGANPKH
uniref:Uncharacterized protein n=1 Tax=Rhizophora mucronata TaxID=61149 RepID=A0A2P2PWD5_RHIMU